MKTTSTRHIGPPEIHARSGSYVFQGFGLRILMSSKQTAGLFSMIEGIIPPGGDSGLHVQHHEDERLVVVAGFLEVTLGATTHALQAGESYVVPRGAPHRVRNTGQSSAKAVVVTTPGGFDEFVRLVGTPVEDGSTSTGLPNTPADPARLLELARRFGIEMLPHPSP